MLRQGVAMSRISLVVCSSLMLVGAISLAGCVKLPGMPAAPTTSTEKSGDTTKTGVIMKAGELYFLNEPDSNKPLPIDTYSVDLSQYTGQRVKVTGQYSGDTLFVGKIESAQTVPAATTVVFPSVSPATP